MPYTKQEDREIARKNYRAIKTVGDLNFLITLTLLSAWKDHPRYEMIHRLRKEFVVDPKKSKLLNHFRSEFCDRFDTGDIYTAAQEAFFEFRLRIGLPYEAMKQLENGDLPEYTEAVSALKASLDEIMKAKAPKLLTATALPPEAK